MQTAPFLSCIFGSDPCPAAGIAVGASAPNGKEDRQAVAKPASLLLVYHAQVAPEPLAR
jgi:hypothetical protein